MYNILGISMLQTQIIITDQIINWNNDNNNKKNNTFVNNTVSIKMK